jgi:hypothetical protein
MSTWATVGVALGGVLLGSILTYVTGTLQMQRQVASQRRYEQWVRLLNSYQNFSHCVRAAYRISFTTEFEARRSMLIDSVIQSIHDAGLIDPFGSERVARMWIILQGLDEQRGNPETPDLALDAIYKQPAIGTGHAWGQLRMERDRNVERVR